MKILGITAEYNPFHNGHRYHLQKSKEASGADATVAVMSGNFTQRGEPAILDKWTRSRLAVEQGVNLVLELPFVFACNRAEIFARGAVDILAGIGADYMSFGSESGDLSALASLAAELKQHESEISALRSKIMGGGSSFAKGTQLAVEQLLGKQRAALMMEPNNILALEYLKRLFYWAEKGRHIEPITVKRCGSGYGELDENRGFAGAGAIRSVLREAAMPGESKAQKLRPYVPDLTAEAMGEVGDLKKAEERTFHILRSEIIRTEPADLCTIYCIGEGLENKLKKEVRNAKSLQELVTSVVSRRYTEAAVRRMLVYLLMGIKEREPQMRVYGRVLATDEKGRQLLKALKAEDDGACIGVADIPVITNINKQMNPEGGEGIKRTLAYDILASDMYNIIMDRDLYEFSDKVVKPYIAP